MTNLTKAEREELRQYTEERLNRPIPARGVTVPARQLLSLLNALDEAEARLGGICSYPLCACKSSGCQVLDGSVPEVCARSDLIEANERIVELEGEVQGLKAARDIWTGGEDYRRCES